MSMYICRGWPEMPQGSKGSVGSPKSRSYGSSWTSQYEMRMLGSELWLFDESVVILICLQSYAYHLDFWDILSLNPTLADLASLASELQNCAVFPFLFLELQVHAVSICFSWALRTRTQVCLLVRKGIYWMNYLSRPCTVNISGNSN